MKKNNRSSDKDDQIYLVISREEAEKRINIQINKGKETLKLEILTPEDFVKAQTEYTKWNSYNEELLKKLFNIPKISQEYRRARGAFAPVPSFTAKLLMHSDKIRKKIDCLEAINDRLSLYEVITQKEQFKNKQLSTKLSNEVFIVHGRNEAIKETTARFLEKLDLKPIILHEQPNKGRTLIEKFEDYSFVSYAVVILTGDDLGRLESEKTELSKRARQNVIFELGYFIGKLGRERVCALYEEGVEILSDYRGVLYIPLDEKGAWKMLLARELKEAGLNIDLNKVI